MKHCTHGSDAAFSSVARASVARADPGPGGCPGLTSIRAAAPGFALRAQPGLLSTRLLPRRAHALGRFRLEVAAKRIDVDPAAAHEARVDGECPWSATAEDVDEHALDAAFVKCSVPAERDQIPK